LSPFVAAGDKLVMPAPQVALAAVVPHFVSALSCDATILTTAVPQPLSLHILHCQWRC
jgi:hypothetical protein